MRINDCISSRVLDTPIMKFDELGFHWAVITRNGSTNEKPLVARFATSTNSTCRR